MNKLFMTSDLHFGHDKDFLYGSRGFSNIEEHDETIISNWNKVVSEDDTVFVLGDLMLGDSTHGCDCFNKLNGYKHIILGNHDTNKRIALYNYMDHVVDIEYGNRLRYRGYRFFLSHYPTLVSNMDDYKPYKRRAINLCGHSHTKDRFSDMDKGLIYHCELDAHDNKPVDIDEIIEDLKKYEKNFITNTEYY